MKHTWVTVYELAKELSMSVVSIRRAYRKGDIPVLRICRMVRFDLGEVKEAMRLKRYQTLASGIKAVAQRRATGGASRRSAQPDSPRAVKRGRNFQPSARRNA